jgi:PTH1 family peptidyl-tRNA hydrolase
VKLIVGLGNPGLCYKNTRHNSGAKALRVFAKENKAKLILERSLKSRIAEVDLGGNKCLLAIPTTFMNLSGEALKLLIKSKNILPKDLLVIHDDMDLQLGSMRFKKQGSSGGHRGVFSIIKALGTQDFNRLKLGVGKSSSRDQAQDYVLSKFSRSEQKVLNNLLDRVIQACPVWAIFGIEKAMNEFNQMRPKLTEHKRT